MTVKLMKNGKSKMCKVHRLVLEAFKGPAPAGLISLHEDDVKSHNRLSNLRWGTEKENKADAIRNGRAAIGERNGGGGKLTEQAVRDIRAAMLSGRSQSDIASQFGINQITVSNIKTGRTWAHVA